MNPDLGVFQSETQRKEKSRLREQCVQRHGAREKRMISENDRQEGSIRTINMLGLYLKMEGDQSRLLSRRVEGLVAVWEVAGTWWKMEARVHMRGWRIGPGQRPELEQ